MVTGLGEGKLWIHTNCKLGEGWALLGYSWPIYAIWVVPITTKLGY